MFVEPSGMDEWTREIHACGGGEGGGDGRFGAGAGVQGCRVQGCRGCRKGWSKDSTQPIRPGQRPSPNPLPIHPHPSSSILIHHDFLVIPHDVRRKRSTHQMRTGRIKHDGSGTVERRLMRRTGLDSSLDYHHDRRPKGSHRRCQ
jgi:hypothetical protein